MLCNRPVRSLRARFSMLIFVEHEPSLSSSSTLTQRIPLPWRESGKQSPSSFFRSFSTHWRLQDTSQRVKRHFLASNRPRRTPVQPHPTQAQPPMTPAPLSLPYLPQTPRSIPNSQFSSSSGDIPDLSIRHHGAFLGFSIELSVSNHVRECSPVLYGL
jgi:hypothetical protein